MEITLEHLQGLSYDEIINGEWKWYHMNEINAYGLVKRNGRPILPSKSSFTRQFQATYYMFVFLNEHDEQVRRTKRLSLIMQELFFCTLEEKVEVYHLLRRVTEYFKQETLQQNPGAISRRYGTCIRRKPTRTCTNCGRPTSNYRCAKCWKKYDVDEDWMDYNDCYSIGPEILSKERI